MTVPPHNPSRSSAFPATKTAPVAEFRCLFSTDVVRKHKRWQDGFVKLHVFNNRVMLYDSNRYFQGDTYWKESHALDEGEELLLDKGYPVQVAERLGVTQTDLTPLFEKNRKEPVRPSPRSATKAAAAGPRAQSQQRHKSLNALLGTPKGPIGKALPIKSPYDQRREQEEAKEKENKGTLDGAGRAAKRQKVTHVAAVSRPTRSVPSAAPKLAKPSTVPETRPLPVVPTLCQPATSRFQQPSSEITAQSTFNDIPFQLSPSSPSTVLQRQPAALSVEAPAAALGPTLLKQTPTRKAPRLPKGSIPLPHLKSLQSPQPPPRSSSPPVSTTNKFTNVHLALEAAKRPTKEPSPPESPPRDPQARSLRLGTGPKRRMLICQELAAPQPRTPKQPSPPQSKGTEEVLMISKPKHKRRTDPARKTRPPKASELETLEYRSGDGGSEVPDYPLPTPSLKLKPGGKVAVAERKPPLSISEHEPVEGSPIDQVLHVPGDALNHKPRPVVSKKLKSKPEIAHTCNMEGAALSAPAFEVIDAIHGLLDEQMVPKPSPQREQQLQATSNPPPAPSAKNHKAAVSKRAAAPNRTAKGQISSNRRSSPAQPTEQTSMKSTPRKAPTTRHIPVKVQSVSKKPFSQKPSQDLPAESAIIPNPNPPALVHLLPTSPGSEQPPVAHQPCRSTPQSLIPASVLPNEYVLTDRVGKCARKTAIAASVDKINPIYQPSILPPQPTPTVVRQTRKAKTTEEAAGQIGAETLWEEMAVPETSVRMSKRKRRMVIEGAGGCDIPIGEDEIEDDVVEPKYLSGNSTTTVTGSTFRRERNANDVPERATGGSLVLSMSVERERRNLPSLHLSPAAVEEQKGEWDHDGAPSGPAPDTAVPDLTQGTPSPSVPLAESENALINRASYNATARFEGGPTGLISRTDAWNILPAIATTFDIDISTTSGNEMQSDYGRESEERGPNLDDLSSPVMDTDVGPWSSEALDLFHWRPVGEEG